MELKNIMCKVDHTVLGQTATWQDVKALCDDAIAFGTAHGIYKTKPILNMDIISEVRALTDLPLVMHGGSGISHEEYRDAIARGIGKINYFSYMSYDGYAEAKATVEKKDAQMPETPK